MEPIRGFGNGPAHPSGGPAFALPDPAAGRTELEIDRAQGKVRFWIGGQSYELPPFEPQDYQEAEAYLMARRKDPIKAVRDQLLQLADDPQLQKLFLDRAWQDLRLEAEADRLPDYQVKKWLDSEEGTVWQYWFAFKKRYPGITPADVRKMFTLVGTAEARKRRQQPDPEAFRREAQVGVDVANQELIRATGVGGEPGNADLPAKG